MLKKRRQNHLSEMSRLSYQKLEPRELLSADYTLVSANELGQPAGGSNFFGYGMVVTPDGRYVAYMSDSDDLVPDDNNGHGDIFHHDVLLGKTTRVSTNYLGQDANDDIWAVGPTISDDGRYVAFHTFATDMLEPDGEARQIYVRDMKTGSLKLVSTLYGTDEYSHSNNIYASISGDGMSVAFQTFDSNVAIGDSRTQIVVRDLRTGDATIASSTRDGEVADSGINHAPKLSYNGRYVAFFSGATNLGGEIGDEGDNRLYRKDLLTGEIINVSPGVNANVYKNLSISDDGRFIAYENDFEAIPGKRAHNEVLLADVELGTLTRICNEVNGLACNSNSYYPSISRDGNTVSFASSDSDIVDTDMSGFADIFIWSRLSGETRRIEMGYDGRELDSHSQVSALNGDATYLVFQSKADNIITSDNDDGLDIYHTLLADYTVVQHRSILYRDSAFSDSSVEEAIATDKFPLMNGRIAKFENYTSSPNGINGLVIDFDSKDPISVNANDFVFHIGNEDDVSNWTEISPAFEFSFESDGGFNNSDRVVLTFDDGAITNPWLQTTIVASTDNGLTENDVFYFGNAIGETGNDATDAKVDLVDVALTRSNQSGFSPVPVDNPFDFNRDSRVNLVDVAIARNNQTGFSSLNLITPNDFGNRNVSDVKSSRSFGFDFSSRTNLSSSVNQDSQIFQVGSQGNSSGPSSSGSCLNLVDSVDGSAQLLNRGLNAEVRNRSKIIDWDVATQGMHKNGSHFESDLVEIDLELELLAINFFGSQNRRLSPFSAATP